MKWLITASLASAVFTGAAAADDSIDVVAANQAPPETQSVQPPKQLIVERAYVMEAIKRGAIIWDVRAQDDYKKGHIAGAVNIGDPLRVLREENSEDFVAHELIEEILGGAGIDPRKEIVTYGVKATPAAYFALYALQHFGARQAYVYHGGIDDWKASGQPLSTEQTFPARLMLELKAEPRVAISTQEVVRKLNDAGVQLLDVRTAREFAGEDVRALRGGRIPGAINIPYERNYLGAIRRPGEPPPAPKDMLSLKSRDDLKALYAKLDPEKEIVVYCQSGSRASVSAAVLKDLGFKNVRLYDSSWLDYGNTLDAPAESVRFFNVGAMNARMASMQRRIEELEKELAALKGKQ